MKPVKRNIFWILFILFGLGARPVLAQTFTESKERKKLWKHWNKKKEAYNPNVKHGKSTHAQSKKEARENKKVVKKANKVYKKQLRKSKKHYKSGH